MPSDKVLYHLQKTLLQAVLLRRPLPGQTETIRFPDLPFLTRQPFIFLIDANIPKPIIIDEAPKPIRMLSVETLLQESQGHEDIAYLQFHVAEVTEFSVSLTLEARIAVRDLKQKALGLSSVTAKFVKIANEWKVLDEPVYSAA